MSKEQEPPRVDKQSIWNKLTPEEALNLGEKIFQGIEQGKLPPNVYGPILDRLIRFATEDSQDHTSPKIEEKQKGEPSPNRVRHLETLANLPPTQREFYERRRKTSRSIYEANNEGPKKRNRRKKY